MSLFHTWELQKNIQKFSCLKNFQSFNNKTVFYEITQGMEFILLGLGGFI